MDKKVKALMMKVAEYIEKTQPILDEHNEQRIQFIKRATETAELLAERGIIDRRKINDFIDKIASDPSSVWSFIEKLSSAITADDIGIASHVKVSSDDKVCPFERVFFGIGTNNFGSVD